MTAKTQKQVAQAEAEANRAAAQRFEDFYVMLLSKIAAVNVPDNSCILELCGPALRTRYAMAANVGASSVVFLE